MLHPFHTDISGITLPTRFTYPFCYTPHPLCVRAAEEVQQYLAGHPEWGEEKMFGVLVVQADAGEVGYLAAFSGILAGKNRLPFFVPPVYDLLQPDGFFKQGEAEISALNARIAQMEQDKEYLHQKEAFRQCEAAMRDSLDTARQALKTAKAKREERRRYDCGEQQRRLYLFTDFVVAFFRGEFCNVGNENHRKGGNNGHGRHY